MGRVLLPTQELCLLKLKLDHNLFGNAGLEQLAEGLAMNRTLESLSLCYCGIDNDGAVYIQQILAYYETKLEKLKLQGNLLKNKGVFQIFRALEINETLEKINLADNQFGESTEIPVVEKICEVIVKNKSLGSYNLKFNGLYEECNCFININNCNCFIAGKKFLECIKQGKHVYKMDFSEEIPKDLNDELKNSMKKNKPKKKKKKPSAKPKKKK